MNSSIFAELESHIRDLITDNVLTPDNVDEWHDLAFNDDYYIIGYYNASQWLKNHDLGEFEALADLLEYEIDQFGECTLKPIDINSETVVNRLVYFYGQDVLSEIQDDLIEELENSQDE